MLNYELLIKQKKQQSNYFNMSIVNIEVELNVYFLPFQPTVFMK